MFIKKGTYINYISITPGEGHILLYHDFVLYYFDNYISIGLVSFVILCLFNAFKKYYSEVCQHQQAAKGVQSTERGWGPALEGETPAAFRTHVVNEHPGQKDTLSRTLK